MLERAHLARPLEVFVKINTGMNRLGIAPRDVRGAGRAPHALRFGRRAAPDDASRARRRGRRHRASRSPSFDAACRGLPYPRSIANSAGVVRYAEVGGDIVRPGHHALRRDAVSVRLGGDDRRAAGDDAALARSSRCRTLEAERQRRLRRVLHGDARASHRRRRLRLRRRLSAARAERNAGARVRQEGAHWRAACRWT